MIAADWVSLRFATSTGVPRVNTKSQRIFPTQPISPRNVMAGGEKRSST